MAMARTLCAALVLFSAACVRAQLHAGDWPQFGRNTAFLSYNGVGNDGGHEEWVFDAGDRVVGSPAVAAGRVWVGSDNGNMYCFNQTTGQVLWKFATQGAVRSSPAVDVKLNVYFGSYDFNVYKLDVNGKMAWSVNTSQEVYAPATLTDDGTVLIGSQNGVLFAINSDTGKINWSFKDAHGLPMNAGAAIGQDFKDRCIVKSYSGMVYALRIADGTQIWSQQHILGAGGGGTTIVGSVAYMGSWNRQFYAHDMNTGQVLWRFDAKGEIESHPAYADGIVYVSAEESHTLFALNATDGTQLWSFSKPSQEINGSPSLSKELVFVGANDHYMYALDRLTGTMKFRFETCANVFSSAAIADNGMIYFGCNTVTAVSELGSANLGKLYAVNPAKHL